MKVFFLFLRHGEKPLVNTLKVGLLLVGLTALFVVIGGAIGGPSGAVIALVIAALMNLGTYWYSDRIVLASCGAQPIGPEQAPELHAMLERLSERAGISTPRLYLVPDSQPNAFATGRGPSHAAVAVNQGLLDLLGPREVEGVLAHEIAHIKHRDTLTMTIVATIAGAIMTLVQIGQFGMLFGGLSGQGDEEDSGGNPLMGLALLLIAPIAATLIQMAVSRTREYEADATAARLTGSPDGLIGALLALERGTMAIPPATATPSTAHLCIANPLSGAGSSILSLFQTHPPIARRVERLAALRGESLLPAA